MCETFEVQISLRLVLIPFRVAIKAKLHISYLLCKLAIAYCMKYETYFLLITGVWWEKVSENNRKVLKYSFVAFSENIVKDYMNQCYKSHCINVIR